MQINYRSWKKKAAELNLDIVNDQEDNIAMALHIYDTVGPQAWSTYSKCKGAKST